MSAIYAKRYVAVFLCTYARGPHLSYSAAAKVLKKSKHFVKMWVERYRDTKPVDNLPGKGVPSRKAGNPPLRGLHGKTLGMGYGKCWSRLVQFTFSDEASFWAWGSIKRAWSAAGERFLQRTVKHPIKIHVWGCFSQRVFGCIELFTENLNAQEMVQIYEHGLRSAEKMFGVNNNDWILQEDNDPKHRKHRSHLLMRTNRKCVECREEETCRKACIHPKAALSTN